MSEQQQQGCARGVRLIRALYLDGDSHQMVINVRSDDNKDHWFREVHGIIEQSGQVFEPLRSNGGDWNMLTTGQQNFN